MIRALEGAARSVGVVNRGLVFVGGAATIALLTAIVMIIGAGVWWRYILNDSISWTEELSKYLMVWMTFMGAPVALRLRGHVGIELFPDMLPRRLRQFAYAIIHIIVILVMIALTWYGWKLALNARMQTAAVIDISLIWVYIALPIGTAAMALISLESFFQASAGALGSPDGYETIEPDTLETGRSQ